MRFLADECCPRSIVAAMRTAGLDVRHMAEAELGSTDEALLAMAHAEGRILVTEDFDFGYLVFRDGLKAMGIIILFLPRSDAGARAERLLKVLGTDGLAFSGKLTVISGRRIRQRALPA